MEGVSEGDDSMGPNSPELVRIFFCVLNNEKLVRRVEYDPDGKSFIRTDEKFFESLVKSMCRTYGKPEDEWFKLLQKNPEATSSSGNEPGLKFSGKTFIEYFKDGKLDLNQIIKDVTIYHNLGDDGSNSMANLSLSFNSLFDDPVQDAYYQELVKNHLNKEAAMRNLMVPRKNWGTFISEEKQIDAEDAAMDVMRERINESQMKKAVEGDSVAIKAIERQREARRAGAKDEKPEKKKSSGISSIREKQEAIPITTHE